MKFKVSLRRKSDNKYVQQLDIVCDNPTLAMLATQTAACILNTCNQYSGYEVPTVGAGTILAGDWTVVGFRNALVTQTEFLYRIVEAYVENRSLVVVWRPRERQLIADALSAFQKWKTDLHGHEPFDHNQHLVYLDKLGKNIICGCNKDWTEQNERLLALKAMNLLFE